MRVVYLNPARTTAPYGGVQKLFDHVQTLCAAGFDAAVVSPSTFSPAWFDTTAPMLTPPVVIGPGDLLAIPEVFGDKLAALLPGVPRVSINQNGFNTFNEVGDPSRHPYYRNPDLRGVLTVSHYDRALIQRAFPDVRIHHVPLFIDPARFGFTPSPRAKKIAYMPRKRGAMASLVVAALEAQGALDGWELVRLEGMSQQAVAETLAECRIFMSFAEREGFGLPAAEALAAGCHVVGFSGVGGGEYFDTAHQVSRVPEDDVLAFIEATATLLTQDPWRLDGAIADSEAVLSRYNAEVEAAALVAMFTEACQEPAATSTAASTVAVGGTLQDHDLNAYIRKPLRKRITGRIKREMSRG